MSNPTGKVGEFTDRKGERKLMKCGLWAEIIEYRGCKDIDVKFDNGIIIYNRRYDLFKNKNLTPDSRYFVKNNRVGEKRIMKCGLEAKIVEYKSNNNITVEFVDGAIAYGKKYEAFTKGAIGYPKDWAKKYIGSRKLMNCGLWAEIIDYKSYRNITVKLEDGTDSGHIEYNRSYKDFEHGGIHKSEDRTITKVGERNKMNCGLWATITEYRSCADITLQFEDGETLYSRTLDCFNKGSVGHTTIKLAGSNYVKKGSYLKTFSIHKLSFRNKETRDVYYECTCDKCNYNGILTPQEILEHTCK